MKNNRNNYSDLETIKAIHDDKFESFLNSIGVLDDVLSGKCKCKFCGRTVTLDNIYTVFPENKQTKFSCENVACLVKLSKYLSNK